MANPSTPVFPSAVATDTNLPVLKDDAYTTLNGAINNVVTTLVFTDATVFNLPCLIVIDSEIIRLGPTAIGNSIANCIRGFRGTAASHANSADCFGYVFQENLNQLSAEVKAVEGQLGVNLANVTKPSTALTGDLGGTVAAPTVVSVGGQSAATVAASAALAHTQNTDSGTSSSTFAIGVGGPKIKNNGSGIDLRNTADSDYVDLTVKNLTVQGTTTTIHSVTVTIDDNIVVLNAGATGAPTINGGIQVHRGSSTDSDLIWDESTDKWKAGIVGAEAEILLAGVTAGGDLTGTLPSPSLANTAVTPGTYGDGTHVAVITVDAKGRITGATGAPVTGAPPSGAASGDLTGSFPNPTVAQVGGSLAANIHGAEIAANGATNTNTPNALVKRDSNGDFSARIITASLNGSASTAAPSGTAGGELAGTYPNPSLAATTVTAGTYDTEISITVDAKGRLTAASNAPAAHIRPGTSGPATGAAGAAAGTGSTITVTGVDCGGKLSVAVGTGPSPSTTLVTITFAASFIGTPYSIVLTPGNPNAAALTAAQQVYINTLSASGFTINVGSSALGAGSLYIWYFMVIGA